VYEDDSGNTKWPARWKGRNPFSGIDTSQGLCNGFMTKF
jgi:hypothetical protein